MTSSDTISTELARWIADFDPAAAPEKLRRATADLVLDTSALAVASHQQVYARAALAGFEDDRAGGCLVLGGAERVSAAAAAVANGTSAHGEDYDSTFEGCPVHCGVVAIPALFAAGEAYGLDRSAVFKGLVVTVEMMSRFGVVAKRHVHAQGFHPTAVLGAVSAAAGVAAARGMKPAAVRNAIGIAGSMASGIIEYLADGSWTKRLHPGWSAQCGLRAAAMAGAGFVGPKSVIEGSHGIFDAFARDLEADLSPITAELGARWMAAEQAFKPYACGTMTQPYIDCAVRLGRNGPPPERIERVLCRVGEGTVHRLWEPAATKKRPPTDYAAKFSTPFVVATGYIDGAVGLAAFTEEAIAREDLLKLAAKVEYQVDPANPYPSRYTGHVAITLDDGTVLEETQDDLRGGVAEPLSQTEIRDKARANIEFGGWDGARLGDLVAFAEELVDGQGAFSTRSLEA